MAVQPSLAPYQPDLVWFHGTDKVRFLNDLISQEIADMGPGESRRSMLLGADGKINFMLWVLRTDDAVGLLVEEPRGDELARTLGRYRIRVDVAIELETAGRHLVIGDWEGFDLTWGDMPRHLVIGEKPPLSQMGEGEFDAIRIAAGEPKWGQDVTGSTIPQESSLVPLAVDFTKGCYLGQELVARIDSRGGQAPRMLRHLHLEAPVEVGTPITFEGGNVGTLSSVAGALGLALVHRKVGPGETVSIGSVNAVVGEITRKSQG